MTQECSNHHPSLSTLRLKGLSHSKMKWWAIYNNLPVNAIVRLPHPWSGHSQGQETLYIYIYCWDFMALRLIVPSLPAHIHVYCTSPYIQLSVHTDTQSVHSHYVSLYQSLCHQYHRHVVSTQYTHRHSHRYPASGEG